MPRATEVNAKVFYKGTADDFIVFVDDAVTLNEWRKDRSVPLARVLNGWKIFVTHKHGAQGLLDGASKGTLESEFGTSKEEDCMVQILEKGECQSSTNSDHFSDKNTSKGPSAITR